MIKQEKGEVPPEVREAASAMARNRWKHETPDPKKFSEMGKNAMKKRWAKKKKKKTTKHKKSVKKAK